jgi:ribose-phosphate pyrophosphokinase
MEVVPTKRLVLVAGRAHPELSAEVATHLDVPLGECVLSTFANGEIYCRYGENIRGTDLFVFQTHGAAINDSLMEQLIMIDAAKRASADRITAVCPFYGYARQDRKAEGREPITARLVADMLTAAGADRVVTVDLHTGQVQGFFDYPVDHLTAVPVIAAHLAEAVDNDAVMVAPDAGGGKLARRFADRLSADIAFIDKRRPKGTHNVAVATEVVGDISGRTCVIVDDMIDTAGTVVSAANLLIDRGATDVYIAATHGLLSGPAVDRLKNAPVREVVVTNTVPISDEKRFDSL